MTAETDSKTPFVPFTARVMAAIRAAESDRPDRLFYDPWAQQFVTPEAIAFKDEKLHARDHEYVAIRARFLDDLIASSVPPLKQIVILGAGMDARAFRLTWPKEATLYELDQPEVIEAKQTYFQDIEPQINRKAIAADLTQPWKSLLLEQGYQPEMPTLWILEGLLMYLTEPEVHNLLQTLSDLSAPESVLGCDLLGKAGIDYAPYRGYFKSGFDDPIALFASYGWQAMVTEPNEFSVTLGRPPLDTPVDIPFEGRARYLSATKLP
ncbi:SAM-dependent methyltransferase [Roseofilum sp. BLCC_M154]|uniref:S-adenosyl-L-methionine-dependent methyltransferase n=1 Tax=Roseofilum acuticapitatum BLCC-M154 TaxID=3022444 RepID=A0ABT7AZS0_9CYAN|nr:SAM-dependent methyltransferase [Roseofilum acuticapitatum]MDJ1172370.1 SAM-dependent methyltransferase [Roseofilum acuticapitatum BLCC-M154]